jgi:hypothetical protein
LAPGAASYSKRFEEFHFAKRDEEIMYRSQLVAGALLLVIGATLAQRMAVTARPNEVEVKLVDGSRVRMTILQENLEIVTKYGALTVPNRDIRKIEFGMRRPEAVRRHISEAIAKLGSTSYKERVGAVTELVAIGPPALSALEQANKSADREVAHRADVALDQIRHKFSEDQLQTRENDQVQAAEFTIVGRVTTPTIRVTTTILGEAQLKVADLRSIRWLGAQAAVELNVDGAKYAGLTNWMDTGVVLAVDDDLAVTASGQVDLMNNGTGNMVTGPAGTRQWGMVKGLAVAAQPAGALLAKIGDDGTVFVIGESYHTVCKQQGRLFLRIAPGPWSNNNVTGSYKVNIVGGRDER